MRDRPGKNRLVFSGPIGEIINHFLEYKRIEEKISLTRLRCYKRNLFNFLSYCNENNIHSITDIDLAVILLYISQLNKGSETPSILSVIRSFMRYAFQHGYLDTDHSKKIPKYRSVHQAKLPSYIQRMK